MMASEEKERQMSTIAEADREYATNVGAQYPQRAWILSDRDVWYRNPYFQGPKCQAWHPDEVPEAWDYQFRMYVTRTEWGLCLAMVADDIDYRNFKSWTSTHAPAQYELAKDIWTVALDASKRGGKPRKTGIGTKR
jgi:hypothetical protein